METADLLRRRAAGQTLQREVTPPLTARGRGAWVGLPTGDLVYRAQNGPDPPEGTVVPTPPGKQRDGSISSDSHDRVSAVGMMRSWVSTDSPYPRSLNSRDNRDGEQRPATVASKVSSKESEREISGDLSPLPHPPPPIHPPPPPPSTFGFVYVPC